MSSRRSFLLACAPAVAGAAGYTFHHDFSVAARRKSLLIAGSSTMQPLNKALADAFAKQYTDVDIVVERGGSLPGLIALKRGAIDLAAMDRDLLVAEDDYQTRNYLIAKSNVTIVVNQKSPFTSLPNEKIRAIFSGAITNWKYLGGPDKTIQVISRTSGSTARHFIESNVLQGYDILSTARVVETAKELLQEVAADPLAIGYVALRDQIAADATSGVTYLAIDGIAATRASVLSDRYPFTQSLYLVQHSDKPGLRADFVAFARSPEGQAIVTQQHLIPAL